MGQTIQELRDRSGKLLGRIEESGGLQYIKDRSGKPYGTYDPKTNTTRDMSGKAIGYGNLLTTLLPMD